jgi:hypothetical protein
MVATPIFLADDDPFSIVIACMFLLILVAGGAYAVIRLRKRYWGQDDVGVPEVGFTLGDLRNLHQSGRISEEEFRRAKEKIVAAAKRSAERDAPAPGAGARNRPPGGQ